MTIPVLRPNLVFRFQRRWEALDGHRLGIPPGPSPLSKRRWRLSFVKQIFHISVNVKTVVVAVPSSSCGSGRSSCPDNMSLGYILVVIFIWTLNIEFHRISSENSAKSACVVKKMPHIYSYFIIVSRRCGAQIVQNAPFFSSLSIVLNRFFWDRVKSRNIAWDCILANRKRFGDRALYHPHYAT